MSTKLTTGSKIGNQLKKSWKTTPVQKGGEFSLLTMDGKRRIATLSPRSEYCILERLPKAVRVDLKAAGKPERGRYVVREADVAKAKTIITEAAKAVTAIDKTTVARVKAIKDKQSADPPKTTRKRPRTISRQGAVVS
jgi:hypothetical protein